MFIVITVTPMVITLIIMRAENDSRESSGQQRPERSRVHVDSDFIYVCFFVPPKLDMGRYFSAENRTFRSDSKPMGDGGWKLRNFEVSKHFVSCLGTIFKRNSFHNNTLHKSASNRFLLESPLAQWDFS